MSTLTLSTIRHNLSKFDLSGLSIPVVVLVIMAMLVLPLPPLLLDFLFTFNIVISLVIIMIAISTRKPLEFSSFPTVLLFATMLRLALNVASTRVGVRRDDVVVIVRSEHGVSCGELALCGH